MNSALSEMNNRSAASTVTLLTGGIDKHYACALGKALASSGIALDVVGNAEMGSCEVGRFDNVRIFALYAPPRPGRGLLGKLLSCIRVYAGIIRYAATARSPVFHILWNYKFPYFDRTVLLLYYKLLGKKIVFTAHNVNAAERDGVDSRLNRLTLRMQYRLVDHIFVHTESMKEQLARSFAIPGNKVTVIPFGVGGMVPRSDLTPAEAKQRLGLRESDRAILFFGRIVRYKGLDLLVDAFERIAPRDLSYRLIIAGEPMRESAQHWEDLHRKIESSPMREQVVQEIRYLADSEMETYFKAADVLALPYTQIFQSGVLFMSHSFGLPVIATDVGTFRNDILEGTNGYVCRPNDPDDLARTIDGYFSSELYRNLNERRASIQSRVRLSHSWDIVAKTTSDLYGRISQSTSRERRGASELPNRASRINQSDVAESRDL
jgi:D-inositol-3-phosphate glycosyltransferase